MKKVPFATVSGVVAGTLLLAPAAHASVYSTAVLADNPTVYYQMNDSTTTVTDSATTNGGSNNGVYRNGGTALVGSPGPILNQLGPRPAAFAGMGATNVATKFDGDNTVNYATNADNVFLANASVTIGSNYSVELWFNGTNLKYGGAPALSYIFARGATATADDSIGVVGSLSGLTPKKLFYGDGVSGFTFGPDIAENTWYHLVFVRSGSNVSFYLNGNFEGTANKPVTYTTDDFQFGAQLGTTVSNPNPHNFNGRLDEIAIYDSVLSSAQIAAHYNAAIPEPSTILLLGCGGLLLTRRQRR